MICITLRFLLSDPLPKELYSKLQRVPQNKQKKVIPPMLNETKTILQAFYRPFNQHLADMLSNKDYLWGY